LRRGRTWPCFPELKRGGGRERRGAQGAGEGGGEGGGEREFAVDELVVAAVWGQLVRDNELHLESGQMSIAF